MVSEPVYAQFREGIELLDGAGERFDRAALMAGVTTPVFFGSAVTNFGVQLFLDEFIEMAPSPSCRSGVDPSGEAFTGFVFKIQANMDPRHRDRVAFVRVCSGEFARDMTVRNARTGAALRLSRAMRLFADDRESLETAYAGDVVGLANPGAFAIGDTLYEERSRALPADPGVCPGTFRVGSQYRRFGLQVVRKGHIAAARGGSRASLLSVGHAANRADSRRGRRACNSRSRSTGWNRSIRSKAGSRRCRTRSRCACKASASRLQAPIFPPTPSSSRIGTGRPVVLFESEWSVRLAEEWNRAAAVGPVFGTARRGGRCMSNARRRSWRR